jgi:hypothetical protein
MLNKDDHHQSTAQQANDQLELTSKCRGYPMGFRSPLVLMSTVGLFTLGFLAPWGAPKAVADGDRLGCATYCQTAGGYGGAGGQPPPPPFATVASGAIQADADGYIPVTVTCMASSTCKGIILLSIPGGPYPEPCGGPYHWAGCSDLFVNANSTRTIAVPLTPGALAYLRDNKTVTFDAAVGPGSGPPTYHGTLNVFPP